MRTGSWHKLILNRPCRGDLIFFQTQRKTNLIVETRRRGGAVFQKVFCRDNFYKSGRKLFSSWWSTFWGSTNTQNVPEFPTNSWYLNWSTDARFRRITTRDTALKPHRSVILSFVPHQVSAHIRHIVYVGTHQVQATLEMSPDSPDFLQFLCASSVCLMDPDTSGARASLKTQKCGQKVFHWFP